MNKLNRVFINEKGVVHLVIPLILLLLVGIVVGVYLITNGNPLKLFSRATNPPIVFKNIDGSNFPTNSDNVPIAPVSGGVNLTYNVLVELTSPLGSPAGGASAPVSAPNQRRTVSYKIAEEAGQLNSAPSQPYTVEPKVFIHGFFYSLQPCHSLQKFLWVEFRANDGSIDRRTAQIILDNSCDFVSAPITPTPTPTPTTEIPVPTPTPAPNVGIGNPGGGSSGGGGSSPTKPVIKTISQVRVAENLANLSSALWKPYTQGMVLSHIFIDPSPGEKFIFVQFSDDRGQIIKINGQNYIQSSITLEEAQVAPPPAQPAQGGQEVTVGTASLSTASTVSGSGGNWNPVPVNVSLSGFSTPGRSIAGLFVRNQVGECSINSCGYIGWTQIRSYGTNGSDTNPWTATTGDLAPGVHMFAVFSLNADGTAGKLLAVSSSNFTTSGSVTPPPPPPQNTSSCQVNVTTCSCDNPDPSSSRYPGKCYPECNGGWCNGGICSTCKP